MNHRRARVAQELRDRLAGVLSRRIQDPRLELVTITAVEVSPDFSFARVYYRALNDPAAAGEALDRAKRFIRRGLAEGLTLRRVPELDFRLDQSADRAARVEEILREIQEERGDLETDPQAPPEDGARSQAEAQPRRSGRPGSPADTPQEQEASEAREDPQAEEDS